MRSTRTFLTSLALLVAATTLSCTTTTDLEPVNSVSLQPALDSVEIGGTINNWVVTLLDAAGNTLSNRPQQWSSNTPSAASIDAATGLVTGVACCGAIITLSVEGKIANAVIRVLEPVVSIVTAPDSFDLPLTTTRTIPVTIVGPGGVALTNRLVTWLSENPSVAVVNTNGLVTAIGVGTTTVIIRAGTVSKSVRVRVVAEPVTSVRILPQQSVHVIRLGQTTQLTAECLNAAQQVLPGRTITWNSNNPVVATVSQSGLVSGLALGSAGITATCDGTVNSSVTAQVTPIPVSSVTITPDGLSLALGGQGQLQAIARDSANNTLSLQGRQVIWSSNNVPVANVSTQGVVAASNNTTGIAQVTVTVDGVASAPVTVTVHAFFSDERSATSNEKPKPHGRFR